MSTSELEYLLGMAGTVAFAVTAVLAVTPRGIDLFGACVMGLITAIGGGTIRDLVLEVPVFWASDLNYIWVAGIVVASATVALAAESAQPATLIINARIIDGKNETLTDGMSVLVTGDKIAKIAPSVQAPAGTTVFDAVHIQVASDKTLYAWQNLSGFQYTMQIGRDDPISELPERLDPAIGRFSLHRPRRCWGANSRRQLDPLRFEGLRKGKEIE